MDILNYNSSIVIPGRAIMEELILSIALAAGAILSSTSFKRPKSYTTIISHEKEFLPKISVFFVKIEIVTICRDFSIIYLNTQF